VNRHLVPHFLGSNQACPGLFSGARVFGRRFHPTPRVFSNFLKLSFSIFNVNFQFGLVFIQRYEREFVFLLGTASLGAEFFFAKMNVKIPGSTRVLSALCGFVSVVMLEITIFYSAVKRPVNEL